MNSHDKVERVLKEIHITFSKCETYTGQPDKIIVDRKKFLNLLDRLNQGIFDMMEQYEQTRQSRENAERAFRRQGDEIIEEANKSAEDVYAASVIYTSDMLGRIRDLMDQTNDSMNTLFRQFRRELRDQKDLMRKHETELQGQLADMADTRKYLSIIEDINKEREWKNRDLQAEKEAGARYVRNIVRTPAAEKTADKPDIIVNKDAAYFKWKEGKEKPENEEETQDKPADLQEEMSQEEAAAMAELAEDVLKVEEAAENAADDEAAQPEPKFPNEDAILEAVLADEREMEFGTEETHREGPGARKILKDLIFGKE